MKLWNTLFPMSYHHTMSLQDTKYKVQPKEMSGTDSLLGVIQRKAKGVGGGAGIDICNSINN